MAKIIIEKEKCIGCGSCAALCAKYFEMGEDGKSSLKDAPKQDVQELEVENVECAEAASEACPVQCIHIES